MWKWLGVAALCIAAAGTVFLLVREPTRLPPPEETLALREYFEPKPGVVALIMPSGEVRLVQTEHVDEALQTYGGRIASWSDWDQMQREREIAARAAREEERRRFEQLRKDIDEGRVR